MVIDAYTLVVGPILFLAGGSAVKHLKAWAALEAPVFQGRVPGARPPVGPPVAFENTDAFHLIDLARVAFKICYASIFLEQLHKQMLEIQHLCKHLLAIAQGAVHCRHDDRMYVTEENLLVCSLCQKCEDLWFVLRFS